YAVIPNIRNNKNIERMKLITTIARLVGDDHIVNLDDPDLVIIVEIFKNICGMSVLSDYKRLKKYNIESIFEDKEQNEEPEEQNEQNEQGEQNEQSEQ
ncbi:3417_t:CDS:2, partial [Dentiscutata erythropus]